MIDIQGFVEKVFEPVKEAFLENFSHRRSGLVSSLSTISSSSRVILLVTQELSAPVDEMHPAASETVHGRVDVVARGVVLEPELDLEASAGAGVQNDCHAAFVTPRRHRERDSAQIVNAARVNG